MGDACGIGPEILAKVFLGARPEARGAFVLGDLVVMRRAAALCGEGLLPVAQIEGPADALCCPPGCVPVTPKVWCANDFSACWSSDLQRSLAEVNLWVRLCDG